MLDKLNYALFYLMASAGGGGSSSGGGGGGGGGSSSFSGGSSSSGGGDSSPGESLMMQGIILIGILCGIVSYLSTRQNNYPTMTKEQITAQNRRITRNNCVTMGIVGIVMALFGIVRDEGLSGLSLTNIIPIIITLIMAIMASLLISAFATTFVVTINSAKFQSATKTTKLENAAKNDAAWDSNRLTDGVRNVFLAYQKDWSNLDIAATKAYLTPRYAQHVELMLLAFRAANRRNNTVVRSVHSVSIEDIEDSFDDNQDSFSAEISALVTDQLVDLRTNQSLHTSSFELLEMWQFARRGGRWLLDGVVPNTVTPHTREGEIQDFALRNNAFYSMDWGRMLLPQQGEIFDDYSAINGDVNNHVIGRMSSTGRAVEDAIIYQIYTYSPVPYSQAKTVYLVGQIFVPKYYGNILVTPTKPSRCTRKRLQKIEMEWSKFNQKYQVYTDNPSQIAAFELLHPTMMQRLADAPFAISLEVIDNTIYFYAPLESTNADNYAAMLSILQDAYRELKL